MSTQPQPSIACPERGQVGQAAVESAIALPMSLFVILGILQMSLMQQARMLLDYAAYKGARAGSVGRAECPLIAKAEIAALVPTLSCPEGSGCGAAVNATNWTTIYNRFSSNKDPATSLPVVYNQWRIDNQVTPFDKQIASDAQPEKLHLQVHYFYQLKIPFANWLMARYFLAQYGLESWAGTSDPINPIATTTAPPTRSGGANADLVIAKQYFDQGVYVIPIWSSWSFRMFSQAAKTSGDCR